MQGHKQFGWARLWDNQSALRPEVNIGFSNVLPTDLFPFIRSCFSRTAGRHDMLPEPREVEQLFFVHPMYHQKKGFLVRSQKTPLQTGASSPSFGASANSLSQGHHLLGRLPNGRHGGTRDLAPRSVVTGPWDGPWSPQGPQKTWRNRHLSFGHHKIRDSVRRHRRAFVPFHLGCEGAAVDLSPNLWHFVAIPTHRL